MRKSIFLSLASFVIFIGISGMQGYAQNSESIPYLSENETWGDSILESMSMEEKIAQLIMIPVYSNRDKVYEDSIIQLVQEYQVEGLIFFQDSPVGQADVTSRRQRS